MPTPKMPPTPVLHTPRLVLRPIRTKDAPVIQQRFAKWEIVRWLNANVPWPYPADGAARHVEDCLAAMARGEKCHWAIVPKRGPADLIGRIDLWPDDGSSRDQRGFWLDPEFWGRGLMTEAANRVTDYALVELGWPQLFLSNAEINRASHRVKEKQGATIVDRTPRRYVYGDGVKVTWLLTREAWLAHRAKGAPPP